MATCREIVTRALSRIREVQAGETASAEDADLAMDMLNSMMLRWPSKGVDAKWSALTLNDTFTFFVPPVDCTGEIIDILAYQGTWDANANSPTLATGTGTLGHFYKVSTAGSTTLDSVTSWAVNDYAVFSLVAGNQVWLQSINSSRFEQAVIDMLAAEIVEDFGKEPTPNLMRRAMDGWTEIQAAFIKPITAILDRNIIHSMVRQGLETST